MKNRKVKIITDSTCDLPKEMLKELDIDVAPLTILFNQESYQDGIDIDCLKLYDLVENSTTKDHPKTSAVAPGIFQNLIEKYIEQDYDIIFTGIGGCLSSTNQSFLLTASLYPDRCFLFDSGNLSSGIAYSVLYADELRKQGLSAKEIVEKLKERKNNYMVSFVVKNLDYLHKGGRAKGFAAVFGAALKVRPILRIDHDSLYLYKKPAGKFLKAINILVEEMFDYYDKGLLDTDNYLFLTHSLCEKEELYIKDKVLEKGIQFKDIIIMQTGTTIGTHCGPGTCGLVYSLKSEYIPNK